MKRYAVCFTDDGIMNDMRQEDQRCRRDFETLDEACKFAVALNKKARYFDVNIVDLLEEGEEL